MSIFKNKKKVAIFAVVIAIVLFVGNWFYCNNPFNPYYKVKNLRNLPEGTPVYIGDNKLFFAGSYSGYYSENKKDEKITCASIYDIKKQKNVPLNACMNVPRSYYIPILLDSNRILVLGGIGKDSPKCNVSKVAEIYDIKENKFRRIGDSYRNHTIAYGYNNILKFNKNNIVIYKDDGIDIFDPATEKFISVPIDKIKISGKYLGIGTILPYEHNKLLIYGYKYNWLDTFDPADASPYAVYYNMETGKFSEPIKVSYHKSLNKYFNSKDYAILNRTSFDWQSFKVDDKTKVLFCNTRAECKIQKCFLIDTKTNHIEETAPMNNCRYHAYSQKIKNNILVCDGVKQKYLYVPPLSHYTIYKDIKEIEIFDTQKQIWTTIGRLPVNFCIAERIDNDKSGETLLINKQLFIFK